MLNVEEMLNESQNSNAYRDILREFDKAVITAAFKRSNGGITKAAMVLGLARQTLRSKMRSLGMKVVKEVT